MDVGRPLLETLAEDLVHELHDGCFRILIVQDIHLLLLDHDLLVTTFNAILVLFKVDKKYYSLHTTLERLRSEGWQYVGLTGRYSGILTHNTQEPTHENQYKYFCHYVEKIKLKQVEDEYYKYDEVHSLNAVTTAQKPGCPDAGKDTSSILPPSLNKDLPSLSKDAPQSVRDAINDLIIPSPPSSPNK